MPYLNKSQSPPHLRLLSPQGLSTSSPFGSKSMRTPASFLSNAAVRRIGSSRRARPVATSIADIFIRSLVIAGYCHEHSPRGNCLSTMSTNSTEGDKRNLEGRGGGRTSRQFPTKRSPGSLSLRVGFVGVHCSRTQRMFTSSVAQRLELYDPEDHRAGGTSAHEPSHRTHIDNGKLNHTDYLGKSSQPMPRERTTPNGTLKICSIDKHRKDVTTQNVGHDEVDLNLDSVQEVEKYPDYKSPAEDLYHYTSKIYEEALGKSLNWEEAVEALEAATPFRPFVAQDDNTQNTVELGSVQKLLEAIWDKKKSNHYIFTLYRELPSPGVLHLSKRSRGALLRRFAQPRDRRWVDARRYLALVEDMLTAGLPVSLSLWTTAIHLAGRAAGKVTRQDLIRAIGVWHQMEHLAGIRSDGVVFTILFDIAIKAGQYTVAERFLEEMERRNIQFGREGKVTQIFYYGLLQDALSVRRAFDEFVGSGEIVDTPVINCLMAALLKAGETKAAEQIYYRLLQTQVTTQSALASEYGPHFTRPNLSSELVAYRKRTKKFGRVLQLSASLKNRLPEHHLILQQALPLTPDTRTFHILLSHHSFKSGYLDAFMSVVDDMEKVYPVPPRGMIYLLLFQGFAHNGRHKKGWTAEKLWWAWQAYLRALHESKTRLHYRSFALPGSSVWENPFGNNSATGFPQLTPPNNTPSELYTPLPSVTTDMREKPSKPQEQNHYEATKDEDIYDNDDEDVPDYDGEIYVPQLLAQQTQPRPHEAEDLEFLERRIENGVFLGRRMIIIILRAFGTCCGPDDVMEVWLRMESIWQPEKRKGLDVLAVKEELEKQLNRARTAH